MKQLELSADTMARRAQLMAMHEAADQQADEDRQATVIGEPDNDRDVMGDSPPGQLRTLPR